MRYYIDSTEFTRTGEKSRNGENIPLKTVKTKRALFLKAEAEALLAETDCWIDFDEAFSACGEEARRDLENGLTMLNGFGIARLEEDTEVSEVRVAGERDYRAMAKFIKENPNAGIGWMPEATEEFYCEDSLRARQFLNFEYSFLCERDGKITALAVAVIPEAKALSNAILLGGVAFDAGLDEAEKKRLLLVLLERIRKSFTDEFCILRFSQRGEASLALAEALKELGFEKVCTLKDELGCGIDATIYDLKVYSDKEIKKC